MSMIGLVQVPYVLSQIRGRGGCKNLALTDVGQVITCRSTLSWTWPTPTPSPRSRLANCCLGASTSPRWVQSTLQPIRWAQMGGSVNFGPEGIVESPRLVITLMFPPVWGRGFSNFFQVDQLSFLRKWFLPTPLPSWGRSLPCRGVESSADCTSSQRIFSSYVSTNSLRSVDPLFPIEEIPFFLFFVYFET